MIFAEKVKYVRGTLQLSQKELAEILKVSNVTVNRWEMKGIEPSFLVERRFVDFCRKNNIQFEEKE